VPTGSLARDSQWVPMASLSTWPVIESPTGPGLPSLSHAYLPFGYCRRARLLYVIDTLTRYKSESVRPYSYTFITREFIKVSSRARVLATASGACAD